VLQLSACRSESPRAIPQRPYCYSVCLMYLDHG
jgi:hypothetical protein